MHRFLTALFLVYSLGFTAVVQADSIKDHYIQLFENGHLPKSIPYYETIGCIDVTRPSVGFVGNFASHGSSVVLVSDNQPKDILTPVGNTLRGNLAMLRETSSGELIMIGVKSFLGVRFNVNPDKIKSSQVQVMVCDRRELLGKQNSDQKTDEEALKEYYGIDYP